MVLMGKSKSFRNK